LLDFCSGAFFGWLHFEELPPPSILLPLRARMDSVGAAASRRLVEMPQTEATQNKTIQRIDADLPSFAPRQPAAAPPKW
jgi:hypothetical protein